MEARLLYDLAHYVEPVPNPLREVILSRERSEESHGETLRSAQGDMRGRFRDDL
jgi:hypothetical protein